MALAIIFEEYMPAAPVAKYYANSAPTSKMGWIVDEWDDTGEMLLSTSVNADITHR